MDVSAVDRAVAEPCLPLPQEPCSTAFSQEVKNGAAGCAWDCTHEAKIHLSGRASPSLAGGGAAAAPVLERSEAAAPDGAEGPLLSAEQVI